ncbi:Regulator of G protein signalling domain and Regulator of G protein signalling superfamily domain and Regulator of G-protein signalling, domain 1-containing protein [Strongyloides ratti]|uniref:Regulator of G protein signalling domain and Regulator of G protein signalling superfamily domain and Regulator of G-protein signalling, domain 1-containing protein n=1 Tax=Strongyloides ratti TaxID=34506 RepID=A0A090LCF0_STRRB|nr:Regulator of G protein signalling domain and Regulator of G protein signalling superfamily domain and Regulator of G-protein signalling, domain 1-containing protein [Strongyloides ratti]CEF65783.1 Regulator of G protein signalling domain and Regulator of G protein signalling superfamily domain and Regulator of G-protein signalling, domain 1-containing protein [Strongyloides ratti]
MNKELYATQQQFVVNYHGFSKLSSTLNSLIFEEIVKKIKKDTPDIAILQLMNSNLIIQSSTNNEILNIPYKNLSHHIYYKNLQNFFGIIVIDSNDLLVKCCYIFSINTNIHNHTFHQKFNQIFQFDCLPSTQLLINECQQFSISIEHILETITLYKNKSLSNTDDNNTFSLLSKKKNDQLLFFDENITKCQKRKIFSPLFFDGMSIKRASLVDGLLMSNNSSQFNDKLVTSSHNEKTKISTDITTSNSTFWNVLEDPNFRESFMQFLTDQYCQENLSFFLIVKQYQSTVKDCKRFILGSQIIKRFILDNADEQINIDNVSRQIIIKTASRNEYPKDLFDQAYIQIENMLKFDLMPRFVKIFNQPKVEETNDKENSLRRKLSFNVIKNKLLKIKSKNPLFSSVTVPQNIQQTLGNDQKQPLIIGTFRRSFVKPRSSIGYLFRNTTLSRSL